MSTFTERRPTDRPPGGRARRIVLRLRMRTLVALGALAVQTTFAGRAFGLRSPLFMGSELLLLLCILAISRLVLPLVDRHDRGAKGEEHVGALLDGLAQRGWRVLHDASLGRGDIDHIVIGSPGIFTIETKSHPGPIAVGRLHGGLLRQAIAQRDLLERAVQAPVEPLIVYSRAWVDRPLARRKGVRVLPARLLLGYLRDAEPLLDAQAVELAHRRLLWALAAADARGDLDPCKCDGRSHTPTGALGSVPQRARDRSRHA